MDVNISGKVVFTLFNTIVVTDTVVNTWWIMGFITVLAFFGGRLFKNRPVNQPPAGAENVAEAIYSLTESLVVSNMGEENKKYIPYIGTLMIFLAVTNLSGLVGMKPPTSDLHTTGALAILTFILIQGTALKGGLWNYLKGFAQPLWPLLPINLIGEVATPFSLAFRLFGNILSGYMIMGIFYGALVKIWYLFFIAQPFHFYFDIFSGLIQTFIFISLTMVYIRSKQ